jgi:H/ACA ribonucleoprotein complex subunit 3
MSEILKCSKCLEYTLKEKCSKCDSKCVTPKPAKWSPEDKYAKYRQEYKKRFVK